MWVPKERVGSVPPSAVPLMVEFRRFALVIPAVPERLELVIPVIVLLLATIVLLVSAPPPASVARVPVVGSITDVEAVVDRVSGKEPEVENASAKVTFLVGARVSISVPAKVIALVFKIVESEVVKVLPVAMFRVLVPLSVMVRLLNVNADTLPEKVPVLPSKLEDVMVALFI